MIFLKKNIKIGIIGALSREIQIIISKLKNYSIKKDKIFTLHMGTINFSKIAIIKSGIGKVLSSINTLHLIKLFNPDLIINIGISGSLRKELLIGDIIISKKICYHDVDLTYFGYKIGQIPKNPKYYYSPYPLVKILENISDLIGLNFKSGLIISGDSFIHCKEKNNLLKIKKFFPHAYAVDMESSSIAQVCNIFCIPFISIRSISDCIYEENKIKFKLNSYLAIKNFSNITLKFIKNTSLL
ncbi:pfs [Wigglesworthia glossinidia endosymbiont of Glossina brevipalpis]|uniref:adenosylhomocysteine nucleosidase n=1 Tax=Wigglesworthia glossinidia brevipalpis TaxID=36870 RepID=Q8D2B8_WIGBR|nr:pfs [Wigglesworthia glossinidia endosymbiont of Glossina brevipalpis]